MPALPAGWAQRWEPFGSVMVDKINGRIEVGNERIGSITARRIAAELVLAADYLEKLKIAKAEGGS